MGVGIFRCQRGAAGWQRDLFTLRADELDPQGAPVMEQPDRVEPIPVQWVTGMNDAVLVSSIATMGCSLLRTA